MMRAGIEPDLLGEITWWLSDDLSLYALVIYIRAVSERTGETPDSIARRIAERHQVSLPDSP